MEIPPLQISAGCTCCRRQRSTPPLAACPLQAEASCLLSATAGPRSSAPPREALASWGPPDDGSEGRNVSTTETPPAQSDVGILLPSPPPPAVCGPWRWARAGGCRSGRSSSGSQSPAASCVENPPPRSSATVERGERSGTVESVQPSAPAWTEKNKACFVSQNAERERETGEERAGRKNA